MDSVFSQPDFDAKSWINQTLQQEDPIKSSATLVTKLQMASEDSSHQFDTWATTVMKSMPRLLHDLNIMSDDATRTLHRIQALKETTHKVESGPDEVMTKLKNAHCVKLRMEQCQRLIEDSSM